MTIYSMKTSGPAKTTCIHWMSNRGSFSIWAFLRSFFYRFVLCVPFVVRYHVRRSALAFCNLSSIAELFHDRFVAVVHQHKKWMDSNLWMNGRSEREKETSIKTWIDGLPNGGCSIMQKKKLRVHQQSRVCCSLMVKSLHLAFNLWMDKRQARERERDANAKSRAAHAFDGVDVCMGRTIDQWNWDKASTKALNVMTYDFEREISGFHTSRAALIHFESANKLIFDSLARPLKSIM